MPLCNRIALEITNGFLQRAAVLPKGRRHVTDDLEAGRSPPVSEASPTGVFAVGEPVVEQLMAEELKLAECINETCPWSGRPVSADSLMRYQGRVVGFCNPGCRDKFQKAVQLFEGPNGGRPGKAG